MIGMAVMEKMVFRNVNNQIVFNEVENLDFKMQVGTFLLVIVMTRL